MCPGALGRRRAWRPGGRRTPTFAAPFRDRNCPVQHPHRTSRRTKVDVVHSTIPRHRATRFQKFARAAARATGRPLAFAIAALIVLVWAVTGPIFHFSDTWQLVINTGTTIVTFLMVFLIQNTQNRDSEAIQLKLDELIRSCGGAHNAVLDIEELSEEELDEIKRGYALLARKALEEVRAGKSDLGVPDVKNGARTNRSG